MKQAVKKVNKVCKCENCGNEAEMVVTCTLEEEEAAQAAPEKESPTRVKGTGTCTHCGNEADMWVEL